MNAERAPQDSISHVWGLTEAQWLQRVQSAEARADAAEARLEEVTVGRDAWGIALLHDSAMQEALWARMREHEV